MAAVREKRPFRDALSHICKEHTMKSKVTPFLWFDNNAEEAMNFYVSVFGDAEVVQVTRNGEAMPGEEGSVMVATFRLGDQEIMALNGGPQFKFTEAISLFIECETQEEVDHFWNALSEGGRTDQCGWLYHSSSVTSTRIHDL